MHERPSVPAHERDSQGSKNLSIKHRIHFITEIKSLSEILIGECHLDGMSFFSLDPTRYRKHSLRIQTFYSLLLAEARLRPVFFRSCLGVCVFICRVKFLFETRLVLIASKSVLCSMSACYKGLARLDN